ncbi:MAG: hypothetical protein SchgKO_14080 [Schleiferiaceae bacterium]
MISFKESADIDAEKWDACVMRSPAEMPYALHWYLDISSPFWGGLVLNDYEAVMPISYDKKYGVQYAFRPPGVQQAGIFASFHIGEELTRDFLDAVPKKFWFADVFLNAYNSVSPAREAVEQTNLVLSLKGTSEEIYKGYNQRTKRNIKKGDKAGLQVFTAGSVDPIIRLFEQNQAPKLNLRSDFFPVMKQLMYVMLHKNKGEVWAATDETNTVVAGFFLAVHKGRKIFLFSGNNDYGKEVGAMSWLIHQCLTLNAETGVLFDFEGSNLPGLSDFYRGFGAYEENYQHVVLNRLPGFLKFLKR